MPEIHGYAGRLLRVDLSTGAVSCESIENYREWIGGRGLGAYLLSHHPDLFQEDPSLQPVVISAGPLVGSGLPMGTRTAVTARNQISGGMCYSNVGGDFGAHLKGAGFDAVILEGSSPEPVYLQIHAGEASLQPAGQLWGMTIPEMKAAFQAELPAAAHSFLGIGPAGEKQVALACLMVDEAHAAGWGGSGAIFGAKRLKALLAVGGEPVPVYDEAGMRAKTSELQQRINHSPAMLQLARTGTHGLVAGEYRGGVRNSQDEYFPAEQLACIREEAYRAWELERAGCTGCSIRCLHRYRISGTRYGELEGEGMHANSVRGFGSNLELTDREAIFAAHLLCNAYGLDVDGVASAIAFAFECAERGCLEKQQHGLDLEWGNGPAVVELVRQIGEASGLGALLGRGAFQAAQEIGGSAADAAVTVKRVGINEMGLRSHRAWALGLMTSTRGGGHLGGAPQTENRRLSPELGERLLGLRTAGVPGEYAGKGRLAAWTEGLKAAVDSLGLCYFVYGWYDLTLGRPDELAELLYLATGIEWSGDQIHCLGLRVHHLERALNYRLGGYTRADDRLPDRFFDTPVSDGPFEGARLNREDVERMLDEYYSTLEWGLDTGLPGPELLESQGLGYLLRT